MTRPWVLAETTWSAVKAAPFQAAVLPWGATEAHNYHLPYATDVVLVQKTAEEAARRAWERGARVAVLPTIPFGMQAGQLDIPFCVHMGPRTQLALLGDVVDSLVGQGVRKLVVLNSHGGNDFKAMLRELQATRPNAFVCTMNSWNCVDPRPFFDEPGDHAGELETSVMLHVAPELVRPLGEAGEGRARKFAVEALREGWAWAPRKWTSVTDDTGTGNPKAATAEKGAKFFDAICARVADFLVDLAAADLDRLYQG